MCAARSEAGAETVDQQVEADLEGRRGAGLVPVLRWFGWEVLVSVQLLTVVASTFGLLTLAAWVSRTTE
jgi:hypothetical protein